MEEILSGYQVSPATWFYLSLLLIIAAYFRFNRIWSVRNLDLLLLLSLAPGLLLVQAGHPMGYGWLFLVSGLLLLRLLCDALFRRRPRLEQNLNVPGLAFLGLAAFVFLMTKVITEAPSDAAVATVREADQLLQRQDASAEGESGNQTGLAGAVIGTIVVGPSKLMAANGGTHREALAIVEELAPRVLAIVAHLAVILGLLAMGRVHFGEWQLGVAMAALYVLLPATAHDVGKVNHVLPAALILWALVAYRKPMVAGTLMGLACGTVFFPLFLLPLWAAFYDRRGALRFGLALCLVSAVLLGSIVLTSADAHSFTRQIIGSIDWSLLQFQGENVEGFWKTTNSAYRIPVFVTFSLMLVVLTFWPRRKTLEHVIASSTAIIVGTQFWYPMQGGVYLLWYLPLVLLVVFRPRLAQHLPPEIDPTHGKAREPERPSRRQSNSAAPSTGHLFR